MQLEIRLHAYRDPIPTVGPGDTVAGDVDLILQKQADIKSLRIALLGKYGTYPTSSGITISPSMLRHEIFIKEKNFLAGFTLPAGTHTWSFNFPMGATDSLRGLDTQLPPTFEIDLPAFTTHDLQPTTLIIKYFLLVQAEPGSLLRRKSLAWKEIVMRQTYSHIPPILYTRRLVPLEQKPARAPLMERMCALVKRDAAPKESCEKPEISLELPHGLWDNRSERLSVQIEQISIAEHLRRARPTRLAGVTLTLWRKTGIDLEIEGKSVSAKSTGMLGHPITLSDGFEVQETGQGLQLSCDFALRDFRVSETMVRDFRSSRPRVLNKHFIRIVVTIEIGHYVVEARCEHDIKLFPMAGSTVGSPAILPPYQQFLPHPPDGVSVTAID